MNKIIISQTWNLQRFKWNNKFLVDGRITTLFYTLKIVKTMIILEHMGNLGDHMQLELCAPMYSSWYFIYFSFVLFIVPFPCLNHFWTHNHNSKRIKVVEYTKEKGRKGVPDTTTLTTLPKPIIILITLVAWASNAYTIVAVLPTFEVAQHQILG